MGWEREPHGAVPSQPDRQAEAVRRTPATTIRRQPSTLRVGAVDDPAERQADTVADRILRRLGTAGGPSHPPAGAVVMGTGGALDAGTSRILRSAGPGRPLDEPIRRKVEPLVDRDLSDVRVHTGRAADEVAQRIQARAFTVGSDIYFRDGEYRPGGVDRTLAHELGHVVQGGGGRIRRLVGPAQVISNVKTAKGAKSSPGDLLDLELGTSDEESALMSLVEVADAIERSVQAFDGTPYDDVEAFSDLSGVAESLGGVGLVTGIADTASSALTGVKGIKNLATGFTAQGSSLDRNIGAKQIESGATGVIGGGGGIASTVISLAGSEVPGLDVAMGYMEAGLKGKASVEDSIAAERLRHQKKHAKREADRRLPDNVRRARYDEFLTLVEKLEGIKSPPASSTTSSPTTQSSQSGQTTSSAPTTGQGSQAKAGSTLGQKVRGEWFAVRNFKHGETKRFAARAAEFATATGKDARVDRDDFLAWMKTNDHKDFGYGTKHRKAFEAQYKAARDSGGAMPGGPGFDQQGYEQARSLGKVAAFGHRRKAETATVNAVDAAGAAVDATGTLTAGGDFGVTKATGKVIKAGSASYKGIKNLTKRARRVHKLRTAKNEVAYGGKSNRGVGWGAKMFFGGNISESQKHTRTRIEEELGQQPASSTKTVRVDAASAARALRRLYTQRERRFNDLWTCLLSDDQKIRERAYAIVQVIANTSLVGALAQVRKADLEDLHTLKTSTNQADQDKLSKRKGQLADIFERELSGVGG